MTGVLKEDVLFPIKGSVFKDFKVEESAIPISQVKLLPPVLPSKSSASAEITGSMQKNSEMLSRRSL